MKFTLILFYFVLLKTEIWADPLTPSSVAFDDETDSPNGTKICDCGFPNNGKIIGGEEIQPHQYPWLIALFKHEYFICGGSIIDKKYILTAAHCVHRDSLDSSLRQWRDNQGIENYVLTQLHYSGCQYWRGQKQIKIAASASSLKVLVGAHDLTHREKSQKVIAVRRVLVHWLYIPYFPTLGHWNDIALLELEEELVFSPHVRAICLPSIEDKYKGTNVTVIGWGVMKEGESKVSTTVRQTEVTVLGNHHCRSAYYQFILKTQICAGNTKGGKDSCQGDSGGPLLAKEGNRWRLAGIVSYGFGCGSSIYPGIYTRVNHYIDWIREKAPDLSSCQVYS